MPSCVCGISSYDNSLCPSILPQTPPTASIHSYWSSAAVAHQCIVFLPSRSGPGDLLRHLMHLLLEAALYASWTIATTACAIRTTIIASPRAAIASPASANGYRQSLNSTSGRSLARTLTGEHAVVDREVAADHVSLLGCTVSSQCFCIVWNLGAVLAVVHPDFAVVTVSSVVGLVVRVGPLASLAHACGKEANGLVKCL